MKEKAPIALFCYNRAEYLIRTVTALQKNDLASQSELLIFSDGPKNPADAEKVNAVREYIHLITGFKSITIYESEKNKGLANSIIAGVSQVVNRYGRVIVLEDDLVTSPYFLRFMNEALDFYEHDERVAGIQGWCPPGFEKKLPETFFIREVGCWGWATWKRGWDIFEADTEKLIAKLGDKDMRYEFDVYGSYPYFQMLLAQKAGKVDSWAIRWYASVFLNGKLGLQSGRNLVSHIGYQQGTHCNDSGIEPEKISAAYPEISNIPVEDAVDIRKKFYVTYYQSLQGPRQNIVKKILICCLPHGLVVLLRRFKKRIG